ncbi:MAG TPA: alanine racemase, partial [Kofleriaceae bacterium]|nr:alanine racemase [Kofleriaceae bacterium]
RLGIGLDRAAAIVADAVAAGGVRVTGIATHLACADTDDPGDPDSMTAVQLARFDAALASLQTTLGHPQTTLGPDAKTTLGREKVAVHAANSAAALRFPAARKSLVRPGIALYGNGSAAREAGLTQAMHLVTEIAQLRTCAPGSQLSYGALFTARERMRIAVLPIGYADGLPRQLTFGGAFLIHGRPCPIAGAVSMDMTLVDVTALGDQVAVGDPAVAFGQQNDVIIDTGQVAARSGLIEYEVTCGLSKRVPRVYRG